MRWLWALTFFSKSQVFLSGRSCVWLGKGCCVSGSTRTWSLCTTWWNLVGEMKPSSMALGDILVQKQGCFSGRSEKRAAQILITASQALSSLAQKPVNLPWGWKPKYKENAFSWKSEERSKVLGNGCAKHAWRSWPLNSWSGRSPGVTDLCTVSFNDARFTGSWNTQVPNSTLVLEGCLENEQHFPSSWRGMSLKFQIWVKPAGRIPTDHRELQP